MPIYAYKCESCGHRQDVLQKISDPVLTVCTACGASTFAKQVTAAGFQLKGSGWYVTDFRGGSGAAPAAAPATDAAAKKSDGGGSDGGSSSGGTSTGGSSSPAGGGDSSSSAAAGGCGASCACH